MCWWGGIADGGLEGWCADVGMTNGVEVEKPFEIVRMYLESGPAESLEPFGDGVKRPANIPHGKMDGGAFIC